MSRLIERYIREQISITILSATISTCDVKNRKIASASKRAFFTKFAAASYEKLVLHNGRAYDSGPRGPGFGTRLCHLVSS